MRRAVPLVAAATAVAALSTLLPWALAFDPEAWLVWGRETLRLELATEGGPSWKPLPVAVTTVLALLGDAAPWAWLVVARAAGLLALAGAAALALRLTGGSRPASVAAAALVALSPWWAFNTALGNSEGALAAAVVWAAVAHLDGRPGAALGLGLAAGLLRPEAWPFLGLYALWLWRERRVPRPAVAVALLAVPVAWCVPELLSSGTPFRAADAALGTPSAEAAARAGVPWLEVLRDAAELATLPVAAAFLLAIALRHAPWGRMTSSAAHVLGLAALAWVALVAAMTAAGFAGTPRYSVPAAAVAAVLAATLLRSPLPAAALVAIVAALQLGPLDDQRADLAQRADLRASLRQTIDAVGGPAAARACATVRTDRTTTTTVAWHLDLPISGLAAAPSAGDTVLRALPEGWRLSSRCAP